MSHFTHTRELQQFLSHLLTHFVCLISHTRASCNFVVCFFVFVQKTLISHIRANCNSISPSSKNYLDDSHFTHTRELQQYVLDGLNYSGTLSFHTYARIATAEIVQTSQHRYSVFVAFAHAFALKWRSRHLWSAIFGANPSAFSCILTVRTQFAFANLGSA